MNRQSRLGLFLFIGDYLRNGRKFCTIGCVCVSFSFSGFLIVYGYQAVSTGQLNTILTFLDITDPALESSLTNIPIPLLRKAISILGRTGRSQVITIADGEGVRFLSRPR
jgi:TRAP-type C4-dicarboxylate transport system permease small subunit